MGILNKKDSKEGVKDAPSSNETVGPLKNANDELNTDNIKVPAIPGTEERVTVIATEDTRWHKKGDEFSIPKANLSKLEQQGYKLKK